MASPNRFRELMSVFRRNRGKDGYVATFYFYLDDSGTDPNQSIAVAAGWIAPEREWNLFNDSWDRVRESPLHAFAVMHMAEFVFGSGDFENWDLPAKKTVLSKLFPIFHQRISRGFGLGIIKKDFDEIVPPELRLQGHENHYTYAIRRVLGFVHKWRFENRIDGEIEYFFDFMDKHDSRRTEIERVFTTIGTPEENLRFYGLRKDGFHFLDKTTIQPLQAADMVAWTIYRAMQHETGERGANEIAKIAFKNFCLMPNKLKFEGGYNKRAHLIKWVQDKGLTPLVSA